MAPLPRKADAVAKQLAERGRHIFAYNHIWTGQTVYSLDRALNNNAAIKQIPFAGKQTVPAAIRKDIWRPLFAISFPSAPQGLNAFRKLREYRKLHELSWNTVTVPNAGLLDLDNPYVRHHTARPPRKERSRMIMDQRANSIADLAAVLREQELTGAAKLKADAEQKQDEETRAREEMVQLAEEERNGGLAVLEQAILAQEAAIKDLKTRRESNEANAPTSKEIHRQNQALQGLRLKQRKMVAAKNAFDQGHARLVGQAESAEKSGQLKQGASALEMDIDPPAIFYSSSAASPATIPKRGSLRKAIAAKQTPIFSTNGVVIRWSNPLDAEFAEAWPPSVEHQDAGLLRHVFNKPEDEPILDAEGISRSPKALRELAEGESAEVDELDNFPELSDGTRGMAGEARA